MAVKRPVSARSRSCMVCSHDEPGYTPRKGIDYTCSTCVQKLLRLSQAELEKEYLTGSKLQRIGIWSFMHSVTRRRVKAHNGN